MILPGGTLSGKSALNKLNIALIGAHGCGYQHYRSLESENVVAICDVHAGNMALAAEQYPKAKQYIDCKGEAQVARAAGCETLTERISSIVKREKRLAERGERFS